MIQTKVFRRHYAITAVVIVIFIVFGFFISNVALRVVVSHQQPPFGTGAGPDVFFARVIDKTSEQTKGNRTRSQTGRKFEYGSIPFKLHILSADGKNLSDDEPVSIPWQALEKPKSAYELIPVGSRDENGPRPPGGPGLGPGRPLFGDSLIRLSGEPIEYLYISHSDKDFHPPSSVAFFFCDLGDSCSFSSKWNWICSFSSLSIYARKNGLGRQCDR